MKNGIYISVILLTTVFACKKDPVSPTLSATDIESIDTVNFRSSSTGTISSTLYIPNTFSPNDDGLNDVFYAKGVGVSAFNMEIRDKWAKLVFSSNDITWGWNGTYKNELLPITLYYYKINITTIDGEKKEVSGEIGLTR